MLTYCQKRHKRLISLGIVAALVLPLFLNVGQVQAAALTESVMRLDNMRANVNDVRILILIKPTTVANEDHFRIIFGDTMGVDATAANITTSVDNLPASFQNEPVTPWITPGGATAGVPGAAGARGTTPCSYNVALSCFTVDMTSGNLTPGTLYGFFITAGIDTPGSPGQQQHTLTTWDDAGASNGTFDFGEAIDFSKIATGIIANDRVVITAVVPPNITFSLNRNTTTYVDNPNNDTNVGAGGGPNPIDIDPTGYVTSQRVLANIGTNALNGWSLWLKSLTPTTPALTSTLTGETIATQGTNDGNPTTLVAGSDYYQLEARIHTDSGTASTGTVSIEPEYDDPGDADITDTDIAKLGGTIDDDFREIAYSDGKTDGDIVSIYSHATTNTMRAAATDYTDTWEIVACANF